MEQVERLWDGELDSQPATNSTLTAWFPGAASGWDSGVMSSAPLDLLASPLISVGALLSKRAYGMG